MALNVFAQATNSTISLAGFVPTFRHNEKFTWISVVHRSAKNSHSSEFSLVQRPDKKCPPYASNVTNALLDPSRYGLSHGEFICTGINPFEQHLSARIVSRCPPGIKRFRQTHQCH